MKVTKRVGRVVKPFVNFPRWMGFGQLWANYEAIVKTIKDMRIHRPPVRTETFEEAKARLHLTDEDIQQRKRNCLILSIIYFTATLIFFIYSLYMIIHGHLGMILGLLITALMAAFTYREHFWYFQLKTRTLGNSFKDWLHFLFRGKRK
ncbi:MAG: hypothetical protein H0U71_05675 [Gammaproteobacteria bacterium]|nr:hypothetical protein [Gammaproteobacteria bacterium]